MNPFERFSIKHLSPSSLNTYAANPALWAGKYLFHWQEEPGVSMARGTAIEAGLDVWLYKRDQELAVQAAYQNFAMNTGGDASDEADAERDNLEPMLVQAITALKGAPTPTARQIKIEHWVDGIEVPIIGYVDYLFEDHGIDLKTTKMCPSSIKADHGRQIALYAKAKSRPFKILYVTAKKFGLYPLTDNEAAVHLRDLERHARAVRHLLDRSKDPLDAFRFFASEFSDFRWSEKTRGLADALYQ